MSDISGAAVQPSDTASTALRPTPYARITGGFWAERRRVNAEVSIAEGLGVLEQAGNLANLRAAASPAGPTGFSGDFQFQDSDVYKWLEAACWQLADRPDASLAQAVEETVALIESAQRDDGYLQTYYQLGQGEPWSELGWGHELYCAGHLMQAAVAHHRSTGSRRLLAVACAFADHIDSVFGPGKKVDGVCGHPEVETALVELFRTTGQERYLTLARYFLDRRGQGLLAAGADRGHDRDPGAEYWQDHTPIRQADEVVGHAVRQLYLLAGAADLATETGDSELRLTLERLWHDMVSTKTYVTGGVGSRHDWESFGDAYELPNDRAYAETCGAIASIHFSWRMALLTGGAHYSDLIERTLFNGFLSGVGLDGRSWLYANVLHRRALTHERPGDQAAHRTPWFRCACCPPNAMRLLAGLAHYVSSTDDEGLQLHQYATGEYGGESFAVEVATRYPWHGEVTVTVRKAAPGPAHKLSLRIPGWCENHALSLDADRQQARLQDGWLTVSGDFRVGDVLTLELSMPPVLTGPHPRVDAARGCVAIERGPLVYCVEQADQVSGADPDSMVLAPSVPLGVRERPDLLGGVSMVTATARPAVPLTSAHWPHGAHDQRCAPDAESFELAAIPYYAWAHRGPGGMRVWIPAAEEVVGGTEGAAQAPARTSAPTG